MFCLQNTHSSLLVNRSVPAYSGAEVELLENVADQIEAVSLLVYAIEVISHSIH